MNVKCENQKQRCFTSEKLLKLRCTYIRDAKIFDKIHLEKQRN